MKQMKGSGRELFVAKKKNVINYLMGLNVLREVIYSSVGYSGDELAIIHSNEAMKEIS